MWPVDQEFVPTLVTPRWLARSIFVLPVCTCWPIEMLPSFAAALRPIAIPPTVLPPSLGKLLYFAPNLFVIWHCPR